MLSNEIRSNLLFITTQTGACSSELSQDEYDLLQRELRARVGSNIFEIIRLYRKFCIFDFQLLYICFTVSV